MVAMVAPWLGNADGERNDFLLDENDLGDVRGITSGRAE